MIKAIIFDCFGVVLDVFNGTRNEEVIELIKTLKADYHIAMCSNVSGRRSLDSRFKQGELDELFEVIIPSGDVGFEKPQKEIYELTSERLGVPVGECLFVDDIEEFSEAAKQAGMQAIRFVDFDQFKRELTPLIDTKL